MNRLLLFFEIYSNSWKRNLFLVALFAINFLLSVFAIATYGKYFSSLNYASDNNYDNKIILINDKWHYTDFYNKENDAFYYSLDSDLKSVTSVEYIQSLGENIYIVHDSVEDASLKSEVTELIRVCLERNCIDNQIYPIALTDGRTITQLMLNQIVLDEGCKEMFEIGEVVTIDASKFEIVDGEKNSWRIMLKLL